MTIDSCVNGTENTICFFLVYAMFSPSLYLCLFSFPFITVANNC